MRGRIGVAGMEKRRTSWLLLAGRRVCGERWGQIVSALEGIEKSICWLSAYAARGCEQLKQCVPSVSGGACAGTSRI